MMNIAKALFSDAGRGARSLLATKASPGEMLPVVERRSGELAASRRR